MMGIDWVSSARGRKAREGRVARLGGDTVQVVENHEECKGYGGVYGTGALFLQGMFSQKRQGNRSKNVGWSGVWRCRGPDGGVGSAESKPFFCRQRHNLNDNNKGWGNQTCMFLRLNPSRTLTPKC